MSVIKTSRWSGCRRTLRAFNCQRLTPSPHLNLHASPTSDCADGGAPTAPQAHQRDPRPYLEVQHLCVRSPDGKRVLDHIHFSINRPEFTAILGPSGSGKTTLLRAIAGLIPPETGEVRVGGTCLTQCTPAALRAVQKRIGFIWQEGALTGRLTALANVLCGGLAREHPCREWLGIFPVEQRRRALLGLRRLRVDHLANRRADRMSGGERQRVGIARALQGNPQLLLADEPVASLDPRAAVEALGELVRLSRSESKPTLVSLHQVDFARRFADRIIALNQGRVVFDGPPATFSEAVSEQIYGTPSVAKPRKSPADLDSSPPEPLSNDPVLEEPDGSPLPAPPRRAVFWILAAIVVYAVAFRSAQVNPAELARGVPSMYSFARRLLPPQWEWISSNAFGHSVQFPVILSSLWETVMMALLGTTAGALLSLPLCLLAARNVSPHQGCYLLVRLLLNGNRAIPDLVFALVIVAAVGLGPFAGTLAIAAASIGSLAKVYAEALESVDGAPVLALEATGAGRWFAFRYGLFPQALPLMLSYTLLSFEHNVRSAAILGLVGAGGIGFLINKYLALFQYQRLSGAILLVVVAVTLVDRISDAIRTRLA